MIVVAALEAPAVIACLDDVAVVGQPIKQSGGHLGIAEHAGPFAESQVSVLVFGPDAFFYTRRTQIAALAAQHAVPTIFDGRDYVEAGGLASYGADFDNLMRLAGGYTGSILKGEKPADLPVVRSSKYELVINLKTANALGLVVPPMLLATADKVIE